MFSDRQLEQSLEIGKDMLTSAYSYCMPGFDDSVLTMANEEPH
jgi:hypothetical protein